MTTLSSSPLAPGRPAAVPAVDELVALLPELLATPADALAALVERHGPVVHLTVEGTPLDAWIVTDPALARSVLVDSDGVYVKGRGLQTARVLLGDGLLTSEGDVHARRRRLVSQAFRRPRLEAYATTMGHLARSHVRSWPVGEPVDVHGRLVRLMLDIVGHTLFGVDLLDDATGVADSLDLVLSTFASQTPLGQLMGQQPDEAQQAELDAALDRLRGLVLRLVADRRAALAAGQTGDDLLSLLVAARDDEGDGSGLSDAEIHDEVMTLLLAGHETTANALAWTAHLLSLHPDHARRAAEEARWTLGDRCATYGDLDDLPTLSAVFDESLRLYPPAWLVTREATVETTLGVDTVAAGAQVMVSPFLVHRDAAWWPHPTDFRPQRWEAGAADDARRAYTFFPFGGGTRSCVGEHFARLEAIVVLAELVRTVEIAPQGAVEREHSVTLRPRGGVTVVLSPVR